MRRRILEFFEVWFVVLGFLHVAVGRAAINASHKVREWQMRDTYAGSLEEIQFLSKVADRSVNDYFGHRMSRIEHETMDEKVDDFIRIMKIESPIIAEWIDKTGWGK
jgi:hypothetical protein